MGAFALCLVLRIVPLFLAFALIAAAFPNGLSADPALEDVKQLLQKGLTIGEIDREVERLSASEAQIADKIAANTRQIAALEKQAAEKRKSAGRVLRAYYMGERGSLWLLIFHAGSFHDLLTVFAYLHAIMDSDKQALSGYAASVQEVAAANEQLDKTREELKQVKSAFLAQRTRLAALQSELDAELARRDDAALLKQQIKQLNEVWEQEGLPLFKEYLSAFSAAMALIPDYIADHSDSLKLDGADSTLQLVDSELNAFLRQKNADFERVAIAFGDGTMTISGSENNADMMLTGHYVIQDTPENAILFLIDSLTFSGLQLPDTTVAALQEQYDLAIYPKKMVAFFKATGVKIEKNKLQVKLAFDLN